MEAICKHNFNASMPDELSFNKGDSVKIITCEPDQNWFKAEMNGKEGFVPGNYIEMCPHDWFKRTVCRCDAEKMLLEDDQPDGAFLLRPSESSPGDFSLSVKWGSGVQHFKVLRDSTGKFFLWVVKFKSLNELVEYHRTSSVSRTQHIVLRDMLIHTSPCQAVQKELVQKELVPKELVPKELFKVEAMYDFVAEEKEELSFRRGDIIRIIEMPDPHWWKGVRAEGETGLLPSTYIHKLE